MISYLADSTFEGLLTAIYFAYNEKQKCRVLSGRSFQHSIDETLVDVQTDFEIYQKMETYISRRCGVENLMKMYKAFLGEDPGVADMIFKYFKIALKMKEETLFLHADPVIQPILKIANRVSVESQKITGFIRFKKISTDLLYANYTPTSNVTALVAPHFTDRLNSYNWVIHDTKRNIFAIYNKYECVIGHTVPDNLPKIIDIESDFEDLWRSYTVHTTIKERLNLKLQMSLMPKKYWHFLTEMNSRNF